MMRRLPGVNRGLGLPLGVSRVSGVDRNWRWDPASMHRKSFLARGFWNDIGFSWWKRPRFGRCPEMARRRFGRDPEMARGRLVRKPEMT